MSKLYFYHSVMNSGKSAHIIMQIHNLRSQGKVVLAMKPRLDTRDWAVIKSRALTDWIGATLIDDEVDIVEVVKDEKPNFVFVDEVNFLSSKSVEQLSRVVDELDIPVFGYGLMSDYKGRLFEGSKRMVELSDTIREIQTPCVKCGRKATMHLRFVGNEYVFEGESIQIGDIDSYDSVCRKCYNKEKDNKYKK